ncbi:MAG: hypothetical protein IPK66_14040 [Rhodospirillales bacterium]|nr:hypothetical protein [Rhodospirillales bacterium]
MTSRLSDLWFGRLPLAEAFWNYAIFWGVLINLAATIGALALLVTAGDDGAGKLAWLASLLHVLPLPYSVLVTVGIWRSSGHPEVTPGVRLAARLAIVAWFAATTIL